jgi:hypothetical protein
MTTESLGEFNLAGFTGTEHWHRYGIELDVLLTDGAKYLAEHGKAYWLLDEIVFAQFDENRFAGEELQHWKLIVHPDKTATLTCDDANETILLTKHIDFTDFLLDEVRLYYINKTIMLRGEY